MPNVSDVWALMAQSEIWALSQERKAALTVLTAWEVRVRQSSAHEEW
jgi:hypothetical protein